MRQLLKKVLFLLFPMFFLVNGGVSLNELVKIQMNETTNQFLINLSEKGLTLNLTQYTAYINPSTLLNNLTYLVDEQNNVYFWFNNTTVTPFDAFYLAKEGASSLQTISINQKYYEINITNPNAYDLTDYQVRIPLTKADKGDQVFDFYDDFNDGSLDTTKWTITSDSLSDFQVDVQNGYAYIYAANNGYGNLVSKNSFNPGVVLTIKEAIPIDPEGDGSWRGRQGFNSMSNPTYKSDTYAQTIFYAGDNGQTIYVYNGSAADSSSVQLDTIDQFHKYDLIWIPDGMKFYQDGVLKGEITSSKNPTGPDLIENRLWFGGKRIVDYILVRKYAEQKPTVSINGNIITIQNPNSYDLKDFQVRIPITQPIFDLVDSNNQHVPFCFEHSNGECDNEPEDIKAIWAKVNLPANSQIELKIKNIFDNINVVDENDEQLNFCFEQSNGECNTNPTGVIWVKVPFIPANGQTTLRILEDSENNAVGGDQVFDFYDDFNRDSLDTSKWQNVGGIANVANGVITYTQNIGWGTGLISTTFSFDLTKGYIIKAKLETITSQAVRVGAGGGLGTYNKDSVFTVHGNSSVNEHFLSADSSNYDVVFGNYDTLNSVWYIIEGIRKPDNTFVFKLYSETNNLLDSFVGSIVYPNINNNKLILEGYDDWKADYVFVRKYADQEPTYTIQEITTCQLDQFMPYKKDFNFTEYKLYLNSITTNPTLPNYFNFQNLTFVFDTIEQNLIADKTISINGTEYIQTIFDLSSFKEGNYTVEYGKATTNIDGFTLEDVFDISKWFIVDQTPPQVSVTHSLPAKEELLTTQPQFSFTYTVNDAYLENCVSHIYKNGQIIKTQNIMTTTTYTDALDIGKNNYTSSIVCYDKAGNTNEATDSFITAVSKMEFYIPYSNPQIPNSTLLQEYSKEIVKLNLDLFKNKTYLKTFTLEDENKNMTSAEYYLVTDSFDDYTFKWRGVFGDITRYSLVTDWFYPLQALNKILIPIPTKDSEITAPTDYGSLYLLTINTPLTSGKVKVTSIFDSDLIYIYKNFEEGQTVTWLLPEGYFNIIYENPSYGLSYSETFYKDMSNTQTITVPNLNNIDFSKIIKKMDYNLNTNITEDNFNKISLSSKNLNVKVYLNDIIFNETTKTSKGILYIKAEALNNHTIKSVNYNIIGVPGLLLKSVKIDNVSSPIYTETHYFEWNVPIKAFYVEGFIELDNGEIVKFDKGLFNINLKLLPKWVVGLAIILIGSLVGAIALKMVGAIGGAIVLFGVTSILITIGMPWYTYGLVFLAGFLYLIYSIVFK